MSQVTDSERNPLSSTAVVLFCGGSGLKDFHREWCSHTWHRRGGGDASDTQHSPLTAIEQDDAPQHPSSSQPPPTLHLVVPVTDDGGSSREIILRFGGPAVGDIRNVVLAATCGLQGVPLSPTSSGSMMSSAAEHKVRSSAARAAQFSRAATKNRQRMELESGGQQKKKRPLHTRSISEGIEEEASQTDDDDTDEAGGVSQGGLPTLLDVLPVGWPGVPTPAKKVECPLCNILRALPPNPMENGDVNHEHHKKDLELMALLEAQWVVPLLKIRLPTTSQADARAALQEVLLVIKGGSVLIHNVEGNNYPSPHSSENGCCKLLQVADALEKFLALDEALSRTTSPTPSTSMPPSPSSSSTNGVGSKMMDLRNASIGNLVMVHLIDEEYSCHEGAPSSLAQTRDKVMVLDAAVQRLQHLSGLPPRHCRVHANVDFPPGCCHHHGDVNAPLTAPLRLPRISISTFLEDLTHYSSQRALSYGIPDSELGGGGNGDVVSPLLLKRRDGGFDALSSLPVSIEFKDTTTQQRTTFYSPSEEVKTLLLPDKGDVAKPEAAAPAAVPPLVCFARGSFMTSLMCSVLPFSYTLLKMAKHSVINRLPQRRVLMLNGSIDREIHPFLENSAGRCKAIVLGLLGLVVSEAVRQGDTAVDGDDDSWLLGAAPLLITDVLYPEGSPLISPQEAAAGQIVLECGAEDADIITLATTDSSTPAACTVNHRRLLPAIGTPVKHRTAHLVRLTCCPNNQGKSPTNGNSNGGKDVAEDARSVLYDDAALVSVLEGMLW